MEFPNPPYDLVPYNGFSYPTQEEINQERRARREGPAQENRWELWLADQIYSQMGVEQPVVRECWLAWARHMINSSLRPDGATLSGGRAFHGATLLARYNR